MLEPISVDLDEWTLSGEGANSLVYLHKSNDGLVLKLNAEHTPREESENEYIRSKEAFALGIPSPEPVCFVCDGTRYGTITKCLKNKKSLARILSEDKNQMDAVARSFALLAHNLHSLQCNTAHSDNVAERYRNAVNSCSAIPKEIRERLNLYADEMEHCTTCLHSDMHIGNVVRSEGRDYWIDFGGFGYGDPDLDFAALLLIVYFTPKHVVKWLLHISRDDFRDFVDIYGSYYYGDRYNTPELRQKLWHAALLRVGYSITVNPKLRLPLFKDIIIGRKRRFAFKMHILDLLVRRLKNT